MATDRNRSSALWDGYELTCEVVDAIRKQLRLGQKGDGVTLALTADDCTKLLLCLKSPPVPQGRPPDPTKGSRNFIMTMHCHQLEQSMPHKAAVAATAKKFQVSEKTVRDLTEPRRRTTRQLNRPT